MIQVPHEMSYARVESNARLRPCEQDNNNAPSSVPGKTSPPVDNKKSVTKTTAGLGFKGWIAKIKGIKHIEIYGAVIAVAIMVLIFFSSLGNKAKDKSENKLSNMEVNYVREMEDKLVTVLSKVKGAGKVSAMVTAVGSATLEIAYNIDEKSITQNGTGGTSTTTTTVSKTPVLVGGQPFVLMEIKPQLKGVIIVASGANDPGVRLNILKAVQAVVGDPKVNIEVIARK